jgi:hypothetical protein
MKKRANTSRINRFPKGWTEARVRAVLKHYESQTQEEAAAEDDEVFAGSRSTYMRIPAKLVPAVRKLLAKRAG